MHSSRTLFLKRGKLDVVCKIFLEKFGMYYTDTELQIIILQREMTDSPGFRCIATLVQFCVNSIRVGRMVDHACPQFKKEMMEQME